MKRSLSEEKNNAVGSICKVLIPFSERKPLEEIERLIVKGFRKKIWKQFIKAIDEYSLVKNGDKIAVAISGGKDSILMAKLFQELKRYGKMNIELEFIVMDPGYNENIKKLLIDNCKYLNIPIKIFESGIFRIIDDIAKENPCYMCAKMRRGALYSKAKELGCNKLALGHHFNDVIETTLLNIFYSGNFKTMLPKLKSTNFENIELIRPMYFICEEHIERFIQISGILPIDCACMVAAKKISSKRYEMKELIKKLKTNFKNVDKSIFSAAQNVNMDAILGWEKGGKKYSFLDFYDKE
ncbi:tRNA 2-thiocytidine biosynthesis TtcA family protein [Caminicella sporogenes]|uniref:tRNA 2-thiocytidine biosynthesis TtcA family protein n=1 Tax=Caminicella sporogenes TaxID=166485 RepID=UPI0025401D0C|nr:ATP-binding protein [Caminicella sporogenes]WIF95553.1 ATP-binding protein [Caminicella sporogenes]